MVIVELPAEDVLTFYHSWHNNVSLLVCPGFESMPRHCITFYQSNNTFVFVISISFFVWWEGKGKENTTNYVTLDGIESAHSTRHVQGSSPPRLHFAFAPFHYISSIFKLEFCCKTYCLFCKTHSINHLQMIQSQINVYTSFWYL